MLKMCSRFVGIGPAVIDHRGVAVLAARVAVADRYSRGSFPRVPQPRRGDLDRLYVIAIGELPGANGRGARCDDRLEQTPAVQVAAPRQASARYRRAPRRRHRRTGAPPEGDVPLKAARRRRGRSLR